MMDVHDLHLAPYACHAAHSRGRLVPEPESSSRSAFQRDRDRILHSGAFRKLKHKTQVFVYHEGDYYRTRLTHSLEVAQIARSICRALQLNDDLTEAVALAHDLGHAPFGHAGEEALNQSMVPYGGFSHNEQALRVLTSLERRYAEFDGLNLTWETLEGVVKHNGPLVPPALGSALPSTLLDFRHGFDLEYHTWPSAEAQVAALADDIAYDNHDLDDGLRAGLFTLEDVAELPLIGPIVASVRAKYPKLERQRLIHETIRRLIDAMVSDLLNETRRRLANLRPASPAQIRLAGRVMVAFSTPMAEQERRLRTFLMERMYRHFRVNRETSKARRVVRDLFSLFMAEPSCLPTEWQGYLTGPESTTEADTARRARVVADYIAGMTDRYALLEHKRLFDMDARV
ncbi:MAG: deoxyguanosinetriphosphate triphosphohydrolase [Rhodospirillaceae bacterium]